MSTTSPFRVTCDEFLRSQNAISKFSSEVVTMNYAFKVTCDECAVKFSFGDGSIGVRLDLTPQAARVLAQDLLEAAQDCEDANEFELEQMQS